MKTRKILTLESVHATCFHHKDGRVKVSVRQKFFNENIDWVFWLEIKSMNDSVRRMILERLLEQYAVQAKVLTIENQSE
jgi:hypothetical protein